MPQEQEPKPIIEKAIHHYFAYRVKLNRLGFRHLLKDGLSSLLTGLVVLAAYLIKNRFLLGEDAGTFSTLARESLAIGG
jgi:hypothetical protein